MTVWLISYDSDGLIEPDWLSDGGSEVFREYALFTPILDDIDDIPDHLKLFQRSMGALIPVSLINTGWE